MAKTAISDETTQQKSKGQRLSFDGGYNAYNR